ncbi:MAG TPA: GNAT family N-acetyltransferase [Eudoraea sp.]|nr:GNAT family N-acetyltransferase [Eudoraea sp.]
MITIQPAREEDLSALVPLFDAYRIFYKQASDLTGARSFLHERMTKKESVIFLAHYAGQPAGFTLLYPTFSSVSLQPVYILNDLYVASAYRKKGVGEALLQHTKEFCKEKGYKGLALETATDNPAQRLYERLGWEKDSHFIHYFWKASSAGPTS